MSCRVVKVGGSLFESPRLAERLDSFLRGDGAGPTVLIAGGGRLVEAIREADARLKLPAELTHWQAVEAMSLTATWLGQLLPDARLVRTWGELQRWRERARSAARCVLDVRQFLRELEPQTPGVRLQVGWHVTSDSIAARVAQVLGAHALILLKAQPAPAAASWDELARAGYIDPFFETVARGLPQVAFAVPS